MTAMSAAQMKALARVGLSDGLNQVAELVRGRSVAKTPLETGDLRSSQTVVPATPEDLRSAVATDSPYAVRQHEDLSLYHDDGEAKYLERAVLESRDDIEQVMGAAVRRRLG